MYKDCNKVDIRLCTDYIQFLVTNYPTFLSLTLGLTTCSFAIGKLLQHSCSRSFNCLTNIKIYNYVDSIILFVRFYFFDTITGNGSGAYVVITGLPICSLLWSTICLSQRSLIYHRLWDCQKQEQQSNLARGHHRKIPRAAMARLMNDESFCTTCIIHICDIKYIRITSDFLKKSQQSKKWANRQCSNL